MAGQSMETSASFVPELSSMVETTGEYLITVGAKIQGHDFSRVPFKRCQILSSSGVPNLSRIIHAPCHDQISLGIKGYADTVGPWGLKATQISLEIKGFGRKKKKGKKYKEKKKYRMKSMK